MDRTKFTLSRTNSPVSDRQLIDDLQRVAGDLHSSTVSQKLYAKSGVYDYSTVIRRFGSWNEGLRRAGLDISNEIFIADEKLYKNLLTLWQHYGRQPRRAELAHPPSTISQSPYNRRFGSWTASLEAFVDFTNSAELETGEMQTPVSTTKTIRKIGRDPSLRLRWKVLQHDRFTCCACGASPASNVEVELHVDHIIAWSKGGETTLENLQTLCSKCNLGKSNG